MTRMPAIHLAASPGRRLQVIDLAKQAEKRGFPGIYCATAGAGDCVASIDGTIWEHLSCRRILASLPGSQWPDRAVVT